MWAVWLRLMLLWVAWLRLMLLLVVWLRLMLWTRCVEKCGQGWVVVLD